MGFWLLTIDMNNTENSKLLGEVKTLREQSVLYIRTPVSVSSVLTHPYPWIYHISWGRKEWLKEKEKECSVIVMVTGESNKLSNSKLFKQKNFIVFSHLKFTMGVPD